jgi:hypothetical protein
MTVNGRSSKKRCMCPIDLKLKKNNIHSFCFFEIATEKFSTSWSLSVERMESFETFFKYDFHRPPTAAVAEQLLKRKSSLISF